MIPRQSWLGSAGGGGVWSLATPGCGSWSRFPATPGWGVRWWWWWVGPCHSWLRVSGRFPATPGWGPPAAAVGYSACGGVPCCVFLWCVWLCAVAVLCCVLCVCGVRVAGGVVWWCGGCVFRVRWCAWLHVCGVPVACGLLSPPLLVGSSGWCLCCCSVCGVGPPPLLAGGLGAAPRHSWLGSAVVRWWFAPCHFWLRSLVTGPRHSWLGSATGCRGWSLATPGRGPWAWFPATPGWGPVVVVVGALVLVCVCVLCGASCWCGWRAEVVRGVVAVCVCVCACGVWFVGCVIPLLVPVVGRDGRGPKAEEKQWKRSYRRVAECVVCVMRNTHLSMCPTAHFSPCREGACAGLTGVGWLFFRVVPCVSFFCIASSLTYLFALRFHYRDGVEGALVLFSSRNILAIPCVASRFLLL